MLIGFQGLVQQIRLDGAFVSPDLRHLLCRYGAEVIQAPQPTPATLPSIILRTSENTSNHVGDPTLTADQHHCDLKQSTVQLTFCDGEVCYDADSLSTHVTLDPSASSLGLYTLGAALTRALALQGAVVLHSAAFELQDKTYLAIGPSGAGKSTLAIASLLQGARLISDDMILLGATAEGKPRIRALRPYFSLREPTLAMLPTALRQATKRVDYAHQTRWECDFQQAPERFLTTATPDVMLLLQPISAEQTEVAPGSPTLAIAALIAAASPRYLQPPHNTERLKSLATLTQLTAQTSVFKAAIGSTLLQTPEQEIRRLLQAINGHNDSAGQTV